MNSKKWLIYSYVYFMSLFFTYLYLLQQLQRKEASFYENIVETERFYPEYFRVGYYGKGFPSTLQGKEFIYRYATYQFYGCKMANFYANT